MSDETREKNASATMRCHVCFSDTNVWCQLVNERTGAVEPIRCFSCVLDLVRELRAHRDHLNTDAIAHAFAAALRETPIAVQVRDGDRDRLARLEEWAHDMASYQTGLPSFDLEAPPANINRERQALQQIDELAMGTGLGLFSNVARRRLGLEPRAEVDQGKAGGEPVDTTVKQRDVLIEVMTAMVCDDCRRKKAEAPCWTRPVTRNVSFIYCEAARKALAAIGRWPLAVAL